ncbi:MAG: thioesterase family protein [Ignavibacteriales bacterium]|nr:thioesterase family protein [Ignavibacteriales bacterium]
MDITNYKHKIVEVVRFHEVDILGVCNNAVYFNYFEDARIKYMQDIKKNFGLMEILEGNSFFIMVHNNCDYIASAYMDDELNIYTRIEFIKNTSFGFKHIVENNNTGKIIARGGGVVVHINRATNKSIPIPNEFYEAVQKFEKHLEIIKTT